MAASTPRDGLTKPSLEGLVWTVRTDPTGKPFVCVSTAGNAPAGATLYVPKPVSIPKTPVKSPVSPKLGPLNSPTASASQRTPVAPKPLPAKDDDPPPPPDDDDDDEIIYCDVCTDDERHPASHRCLGCEQDMCRKVCSKHPVVPPHRTVALVDLKEQELARYRTLFASPEFDMKKKYVEVLFNDPGALADGEIPLTKGEFLEVDTGKNESNEWWHGCKISDRSISGLFPNNYVTVLNMTKISAMLQPPKSVVKKPAPPPSASMRVAKTTPSANGAPSPSSPRGLAARSPLASASARAPLNKPSAAPPPSAALKPALNGPRVSASPSSSPSASSPSASSSAPRPGSPPGSPSGSAKPSASASAIQPSTKETSKAEKCHVPVIATHEFKQTTGSYLSFARGERMIVVKKASAQWWWGVNSKGQKGWVPVNHIQVLEGS